MKFIKKYWWVIILFLVIAIGLYFAFSGNVQQTQISGVQEAMSGGTILK